MNSKLQIISKELKRNKRSLPLIFLYAEMLKQEKIDEVKSSLTTKGFYSKLHNAYQKVIAPHKPISTIDL